MTSIRHRSKPAKTPFVLLAMLFTFLAVIAVRPVASLAAPPEPSEPPQLAFEPGSYDFGLVPVNSGSQTSLQLRNVGLEAVQVNWMEISGPDHEVFGYNADCTVRTLQPNETCNVQVYFTPRNTSEYVAQLRANVGSYSFSADLSGVGGRAVFEPASNPTDFGVAEVGSAGTTREIAVTNAGNMAGGVFIAVISGGAVGSFQLLDENCTGFPLAPAATCTVQVRFRPLSEGVKRATLSLFGEQDGGTQILLSGVGATPDPVPDLSAVSAGGPATANLPPSSAAGPEVKPHRRRARSHRRSRRAAIADGRVLTRAG